MHLWQPDDHKRGGGIVVGAEKPSLAPRIYEIEMEIQQIIVNDMKLQTLVKAFFQQFLTIHLIVLLQSRRNCVRYGKKTGGSDRNLSDEISAALCHGITI